MKPLYLLGKLAEKLHLKPFARRVLNRLGIEIRTGNSLTENAAAVFRSSTHLVSVLPSGSGKRVLFLTGRNTAREFPMIDGLVGWGLRLRGARPSYLICDQALTACELSTINHYDRDIARFNDAQLPATCRSCYNRSRELLSALGWQPRRLSEFFTPADWHEARAIVSPLSVAQAFALEYDHLNLGEHIQSTAYRTLLSGTLDMDDPQVLRSVRRIALNAVVLAKAAPRIFETMQPDCIVAHHGIYLSSGVLCEYAKQRRTQVVNWTTSYRRDSVIFSHGDTYHRTIANDPVDTWQTSELTQSNRKTLENYLGTHWKSSWDTISYNRDTNDDPDVLAQSLSLDRSRPIVGLYTNIAWDAQIFYKSTLFATHTEWLLKTIEVSLDQPNVQLVVRIHPAEVKHGLGPVRQRADDTIRARFGSLPAHIKIIPPESDLSSYALMRLTAANVVYGTKLGIEMAAMGLIVIVAGDAWYRGKGFTYDPVDQHNYFHWLREPHQLKPMQPLQLSLAERYAYHFYFQRVMGFPTVARRGENSYITSLEQLKPGLHHNLDVVCEGILNLTPFVGDYVVD